MREITGKVGQKYFCDSGASGVSGASGAGRSASQRVDRTGRLVEDRIRRGWRRFGRWRALRVRKNGVIVGETRAMGDK